MLRQDAASASGLHAGRWAMSRAALAAAAACPGAEFVGDRSCHAGRVPATGSSGRAPEGGTGDDDGAKHEPSFHRAATPLSGLHETIQSVW